MRPSPSSAVVPLLVGIVILRVTTASATQEDDNEVRGRGRPMTAKQQLRKLIKERLDKHLEAGNNSAVILLDLAPAITCLEVGHEQQPRRWLSRYRSRLWRCERCGYWWRTEWRASSIGHDWHWTLVLADDPVTYSPRGWNS